MVNRIANTYKAGHGDFGYSLIFGGSRLSKDDPACWIYSETEHLNNKISEFLITFDISYPELLEMLNWLKCNSFSVSSFCFLKGKSDRHSLNIEMSDHLQTLVENLKVHPLIGEAQDFIHYTSLKYVRLAAIRIAVRDLERAFTKWRNHEIVKDYIIMTLRTEPNLSQTIVLNIDCYAGFLNRLSTFLWHATRQEAYICGDFDQQIYWQGQIVK
jgi:cob(I)alamin adenosyltransferase